MLFLYLFCFISFGFYCSLKAHQKKLFPTEFLYIASLLFSLLVTYLLFYVYALSFRLGHYLAITYIVAGFVGAILSVRELKGHKDRQKMVREFFFTPLLIVLAVLAVYTHFFYGCGGKPTVIDEWGEIQNPAFCQIAALPIDNALPFIYGENVLSNHTRSLVIDWSIADRPPLQIGAVLPLLDFQNHSQQYIKYAEYNVFSIFLQLSWIGVIWGILKLILKKRWQVGGLLVGFCAVGFFYLNSIFVWPKLLAASLVTFGVWLLINTDPKDARLFRYRYAVISVLSITLGLLAHGGVIFTLLALVPLVAYDLIRHRPDIGKVRWKPIIAAAIIAVGLLLPWQVVKSHLTTHDRLIKWQFAGVISASDNRGTLQTIRQEYGKLSFDEWLHAKKSNVETLLTGNVVSKCKLQATTLLSTCNRASWRDRTFFSTFFAFEFFVVGLFIAVYQLVRNRLDKLDKILLWIGFLTLAVWVMLMFIPGSTVVHQGSYATMLLLFVLSGKKIALLRPPLFMAIISLQVLLYYLVWLRPFGIHLI